MHTSATYADTAAQRSPGRLLIDAPQRMFHWLFALCFVGAYVTADSEHWRLLHMTLGYTLAGLLGFRLLYGIFGPPQARLALLGRRVAGLPSWLRALPATPFAAINWRLGQNLLMALALVALLAIVVPTVLSGYATYNDWGEWLEEVHEFFGQAFLMVVLAHLAMIFGFSLLRRRNLAAPMVTGRDANPGPSPVRRNHAWLAVLLLSTVLTYWSWEWRQSPQGLVPSQSMSRQAHEDD